MVNTVNPFLDAKTSTGTGTLVKTNRTLDHTMEVWFSNSGGSTTALVVDLEGSVDGSRWFNIGTLTFLSADLTAESAMITIVDTLVNVVRPNITTLTDTGTTTISANYVPGRRADN